MSALAAPDFCGSDAAAEEFPGNQPVRLAQSTTETILINLLTKRRNRDLIEIVK